VPSRAQPPPTRTEMKRSSSGWFSGGYWKAMDNDVSSPPLPTLCKAVPYLVPTPYQDDPRTRGPKPEGVVGARARMTGGSQIVIDTTVDTHDRPDIHRAHIPVTLHRASPCQSGINLRITVPYNEPGSWPLEILCLLPAPSQLIPPPQWIQVRDGRRSIDLSHQAAPVADSAEDHHRRGGVPHPADLRLRVGPPPPPTAPARRRRPSPNPQQGGQ